MRSSSSEVIPPRFTDGRRQFIHRRRQLFPHRSKPALLGSDRHRPSPSFFMKLTRISSSSTVHGPLFIPIFVQHGVVCFDTGFFPSHDDIISAVFNRSLSFSSTLGFRDLYEFFDWLVFLLNVSLSLHQSADVTNEPTDLFAHALASAFSNNNKTFIISFWFLFLSF